MKSISAGDGDEDVIIIGKDNLDAEFKRFSNSRSKEDARFLNDFALSFINPISASVESFTSLHPFGMNEIAFSAATTELLVVSINKARATVDFFYLVDNLE
ncbi:hypothetical protein L6452_20458 [Arctium lappa]|uniref:Uncharacterized protein n=1 Tax=Arctium lappa TaxID=4217 RepID=A0ACB9BBF3_ARCLA|nr:hypothetical protein L6452_20458 [Arctium lappa]